MIKNKIINHINNLYDLVIEDNSLLFGESEFDYYKKAIEIFYCFKK